MHINTSNSPHARILEDAPDPNLALAQPPTFQIEGRPRLETSVNQQEAMFHQTPIDWVIWNEFRMSFSLMA